MEKVKVIKSLDWRVKFLSGRVWSMPQTTCALNFTVFFHLMLCAVKYVAFLFIAYLLVIFFSLIGNDVAAVQLDLAMAVPNMPAPSAFLFKMGLWWTIKATALGVVSIAAMLLAILAGCFVVWCVFKLIEHIIVYIACALKIPYAWNKLKTKLKSKFCKKIKYT